jgi:hypothetical protein
LAEVFGSGFHLQDKEADMFAEGEDDELDIMGYPKKVDRQDILHALPSKDFADSLVAVCFSNTNNEASTSVQFQTTGDGLTKIVIVHPPTFRKEVSIRSVHNSVSRD